MTKRIALLTMVGLVLTACAIPSPSGDVGALAMTSFALESMALKGVVPAGCPMIAEGVFDATSLSAMGKIVIFAEQSAAEAAFNVAAIEDQIGAPLVSNGSYSGNALTFDRFVVVVPLPEDFGIPTLVPGTLVRTEWAAAEAQSKVYLITLLMLPDDYQASPAKYEKLLTASMDALTPLASENEPGQKE